MLESWGLAGTWSYAEQSRAKRSRGRHDSSGRGLVQHEELTYIYLGGEDGRSAESQKSKGRELEKSHDGSRSRRQ